MRNKWLVFQEKHKHEVSINTGRSNILADWQRLPWKNTFTDGKTLDELMAKAGITEPEHLKEENLERFIKEVILKKIPDNKKEPRTSPLLQHPT